MWKQVQREGDEAASCTVAVPENGLKRKGTMSFKEVQEEAGLGRWSKKEEEVVLVGQLMEKHLGSAKTVAQPRRHQ